MTALARAHRRFAVSMGLAGLAAFTVGAGFEPISASLATLALLVALFWQPDAGLSARLEKIWGPLAIVLVIRAIAYVFLFEGDVVMPVVDLLLLLLAAESLRSLDAANDVRIYALSFALLLAATAYRPGLVFAVAFVVFVFSASVALPLGILRRKSVRFKVSDPGLDRPFLATAGRFAAVTLTIAAAVFVAFPRVSRGWAGRGETMATSVAGFSDNISLGEHGSTIHANPEIVLRVEFPDGPPQSLLSLHWRGRSYDRFDGIRWSRSDGVRPSSAPVEWYRERWGAELLTQRIYGAPLDVRVLFALHPLISVEADSRIQPMFDNVGDFFYWGSYTPIYTARSALGSPPPDSLRRANSGFMPDRSRYLQLPRLPDRIGALADSLTRDQDNRYDKVRAVESWLKSDFGYTRELPRTVGETSLDHFLFERREGHCEYFSSAMVVLLRSVGIHARNVNGFLGGRWNDFGGYLAVTQNEAHSWVEVWFPGYGWVQFDPTPGGSSSVGATAEWSWPGRVFLDGLQHRWSKWVLDYSFDDQVDLVDRFGSLFDASTGTDPADAETTRPLPWRWALLLLLPVGAWALLRSRRGLRGRSFESRTYLRLLRRARRAGVVGESVVAPLDLVDRIRLSAPGAAGPAARLVDLYLQARFAGRRLTRDETREMREALAHANRALGSDELRHTVRLG